jgi:hypothetical protein
VNRRPLAAVAALAALAVAVVPAQAATKKPKPIKGSYELTLPPDPTGQTAAVLGEGCTGVVPPSQDKHPFTVPARGRFDIVLDSPDPTGAGVTDWDLYLLDADGAIVSSSTSEFSHEQLSLKLKKKQGLTIWVCNLLGQPSGTVRYTFTYL